MDNISSINKQSPANKGFRKVLMLFLVISFFAPSVFLYNPRKASAVVPVAVVADATRDTKEFGLDAVAFSLAKYAINKITISFVEWIRSGYSDKYPSFLTHPGDMLRDIGDNAVGDFITSIGAAGILCGPWDFSLRLALSFQKPYLLRAECTLTDAQDNFRQISGSFIDAGRPWENYINVTLNQQNNPYGSFLQAESEAKLRAGNKTRALNFDRLLGNGWLSVTKEGACLERYGADAGFAAGTCKTKAPDRVVTPGSYIGEMASGMGLSPLRSAELVDELNESIGIIAGEMILQAINPNKGLIQSDTAPIEEANSLHSRQIGDQLTDAIPARINDVVEFKNTKEESVAIILNGIYPIYQALTGIIIVDPTISMDDSVYFVEENGSCFSQLIDFHEAQGDIAAANNVRDEIENTLEKLILINNTRFDAGSDILDAQILMQTLLDWETELSSGEPSEERINEIGSEFNGLNLRVINGNVAAGEKDILETEDKIEAQEALDSCESTLVVSPAS